MMAARLVLASALAAIVAPVSASAAEPALPASPSAAEPAASASSPAAESAVTAAEAVSPAVTAPSPGGEAAERAQDKPFAPDVAPLGISNADVSVKFRLLLQPQYQLLGDVNLSGQAQDLYLRRARFIVGGSLFGVVDYFFDTDYPDLFLSRAAIGSPSVKYTPTMMMQDAFVTYKPFKNFIMVDVGYMLPPMAHNAVQSAATLFGWDYFRYTFQHDVAFGSPQNLNPPSTPAGRDTGLQLRGLLFDGHLEYRVGAFQGFRKRKTTTATGSRNDFRITSRLQLNFLDAEPGFFYGRSVHRRDEQRFVRLRVRRIDTAARFGSRTAQRRWRRWRRWRKGAQGAFQDRVGCLQAGSVRVTRE